MRVVSRWHRVARFPYRVFHSPSVIPADGCRIVSFVPVDLFVDPCVPRPRVSSSYSLSRMLRYPCVRSELGMHRDNRDAVLRSCHVVFSSWLFRCDMFPFVHRRSLRSVRRGNRAYVSLGLSSEPFLVASYLLHRESVGPVDFSLYALRHRFAYVGFRVSGMRLRRI